MSVYDLHFNRDDVLFRNILIGVLATLNDRIKWTNRTANHTTQEIDMPFYFSMTGQERFLQDNFLKDLPRDKNEEYAETVYQTVPRAVVEMGGVAIEASALVNKYVRGNYTRELEDGTLKSFNAEFTEIPLRIPMDITIFLDSTLDQFKSMTSLIHVLYKNNVFKIDVDGIKISGYFKLPEDYDHERLVEFGFDERKQYTVKFSIDTNVAYPLFKNSLNGYTGADDTERFAGNRMFRLTSYNTWGATHGIIGSTGTTATSGSFIDNNIDSGLKLTNNQDSFKFAGFINDKPWPFGATSELPPKS